MPHSKNFVNSSWIKSGRTCRPSSAPEQMLASRTPPSGKANSSPGVGVGTLADKFDEGMPPYRWLACKAMTSLTNFNLYLQILYFCRGVSNRRCIFRPAFIQLVVQSKSFHIRNTRCFYLPFAPEGHEESQSSLHELFQSDWAFC